MIDVPGLTQDDFEMVEFQIGVMADAAKRVIREWDLDFSRAPQPTPLQGLNLRWMRTDEPSEWRSVGAQMEAARERQESRVPRASIIEPMWRS